MKHVLMLAMLVCSFVRAAEERATYKMSPQVPKFATGLKRPLIGAMKNAIYKEPLLDAIQADIPDEFDWREEVEGGLTPIRNQGNCGSCWAFAATATLMDVIKIKLGIQTDLSEQEIVSCNGQGWGCGGGFFPHNYQINPGQSNAQEFPYQAKNLRCKQGLSHEHKIASWAYVGKKNRKPTVDQLIAAVHTYGPLTCTVYAGNKFMRYTSGVFNSNESGITNHMVNVVGYSKKGKYFIMRNSWNTTWGDKGYMKIGFGKNRICEDAAFVELGE